VLGAFGGVFSGGFCLKFRKELLDAVLKLSWVDAI
jgi:hypothetical protein